MLGGGETKTRNEKTAERYPRDLISTPSCKNIRPSSDLRKKSSQEVFHVVDIVFRFVTDASSARVPSER